MNIGESICYGECCKMCKPDDSQTCTPGANNILYVNKNSFKKELGICYGYVLDYDVER